MTNAKKLSKFESFHLIFYQNRISYGYNVIICVRSDEKHWLML